MRKKLRRRFPLEWVADITGIGNPRENMLIMGEDNGRGLLPRPRIFIGGHPDAWTKWRDPERD
jgi:hypothetical protein